MLFTTQTRSPHSVNAQEQQKILLHLTGHHSPGLGQHSSLILAGLSWAWFKCPVWLSDGAEGSHCIPWVRRQEVGEGGTKGNYPLVALVLCLLDKAWVSAVGFHWRRILDHQKRKVHNIHLPQQHALCFLILLLFLRNTKYGTCMLTSHHGNTKPDEWE